MSIENEIVIVSGLPRSGTSLMMQMIDCGGIPAITDKIRAADTDNPRGYYEFEAVKKTKTCADWVPEARGKVVKMVSQLLYDLPPGEKYRIVFMLRDFDEMLSSQEKMLVRLGRPAAPRDDMKRSFTQHLRKLDAWLAQQPHMKVLRISYNDLIVEPPVHAAQIRDFLDGAVDAEKMLAAIDPALYRNRVVAV